VSRPSSAEIPWQLLSHLVLSSQTLACADALKAVLRLYNCPQSADAETARANDRRIDAIQTLAASAQDFIMTRGLDPNGVWKRRYGFPLRGAAIRLEIDGSRFGSEGDLYLFSSVLNQFFSLYASMNSVTSLDVRDTNSGLDYTWAPRLGEQIAY
jgi:type VI secretion system protein ImpG